MALTKTVIWLYSLAVLSSSAPQHETVAQNCSSQTTPLERLPEDLKVATECAEALLPAQTAQQTAALLLSTRNLEDALNRHQLKECQGAEPTKCPEAEVPDNGGLACVTVDNKRYCKPFCNHGYDFGFIRRSRLYDECSEQTGYKWDTQYTGGNKLADCNGKAVFY
uniref:Si:ch1073-126c3.2 n=1 Tax=Mastacembelus armatus TaxID=205130 RepID=A0A7N8YKR7_9TELE